VLKRTAQDAANAICLKLVIMLSFVASKLAAWERGCLDANHAYADF
jgi:hypothetical protein